MAKALEGELIKAPTKAVQSAIGRANDEHAMATDRDRQAVESKQAAVTHAIKCGKALLAVKKQVGHGGWEVLFPAPPTECKTCEFRPMTVGSQACESCEFLAANRRFSGDKNRRFGFGTTQARAYLKVATYPTLARAAVLEDDGERFNLDRTYSALSEANKEQEKQKKNDHRIKGTGKNEWYTPEQYLEAARKVLGGFDLDPASSTAANDVVGATTFFTSDDDGLSHEWRGRVWLNPPYSQPLITQFATKLVEEFTAGRATSAIVLTHNYTDTVFFHRLLSVCDAVCFTRGRIAFIDADGNKAAPTQGQVFCYFGPHKEQFTLEFGQFGAILYA